MKNVLDLTHLRVVGGGKTGQLVFVNAQPGKSGKALRIAHDALNEGMDRLGMSEHCPPPPQRRAVLTRLCKPLAGKTWAVNSLQGDVYGYQFTRLQSDGAVALSYLPKFSIYLNDTGGLSCSNAASLEAQNIYAKIREQFEDEVDYVDATTVKRLAANVLFALGAVSILDQGHAYYLPACSQERFWAFGQLIEALAPYQIDKISVADDRDPELVKSVLAALDNEVTAALTVAEDTLHTRGMRALRTQEGVLSALEDKLNFFADLLGDSLENVKAKLTTTEQLVTAAIAAGYKAPAREET